MSLISSSTFSSTFVVKRQSETGSYDSNGRWVAAATSNLSVLGSAQRLKLEETELLPEGFRTNNAYKLYTLEELFTVNESNSRAADIVTIEGSDYVVLQVEKWTKIYPHYKAVCVRVERNAQ